MTDIACEPQWMVSREVEKWDPRVTKVLVDSFMDDPINKACAADPAVRRNLLTKTMGRYVKTYWWDSYVLVDKSTKPPYNIIGHGGNHKKGMNAVGPIDIMKSGLWMVPFECGFGPFFRLMKIDRLVHREVRKVVSNDTDLKSGKFWYLDLLCIAPMYQGKGIGVKELKDIVAKADGRGMPSLLVTSLEKNVKFFSKFGFTMIATRDVPFKGDDGSSSLKLYFMKRPKV